MSKNKNKTNTVNADSDALLDNTPVVQDVKTVNEPQSIEITAIPLNADGYTCVQNKDSWVLEKAVLKVGLTGVKDKDDFLAKVKKEMSAAGVSTYQSSRYKGMEITDEKVKQRIAYVTQNIGGKNPEHRWTLLSVDKNDGIKYVAAPAPLTVNTKVEEIKE